jgi:hypothetical protein
MAAHQEQRAFAVQVRVRHAEGDAETISNWDAVPGATWIPDPTATEPQAQWFAKTYRVDGARNAQEAEIAAHRLFAAFDAGLLAPLNWSADVSEIHDA